MLVAMNSAFTVQHDQTRLVNLTRANEHLDGDVVAALDSNAHEVRCCCLFLTAFV